MDGFTLNRSFFFIFMSESRFRNTSFSDVIENKIDMLLGEPNFIFKSAFTVDADIEGQAHPRLWRRPVQSNCGKLDYHKAWCACLTSDPLFDFCRHSPLGGPNFPLLDNAGDLQTRGLSWPLSYHRGLYDSFGT